MSILTDAEGLVNGDRQADYGTPQANFTRWRDLCRASGRPGLVSITCEDLAALMVLGKLARDANAPKADNLVDAAGYLSLWDQLRGM